MMVIGSMKTPTPQKRTTMLPDSAPACSIVMENGTMQR